MATNKDATIRLLLNPRTFQAGMRQLGGDVKKTGKTMGKDLKGPLTDGFDAAKKSAQGMLGSLKAAVVTVGTLGGALSGAALVKTAVDAEIAYIALADQLSASTGAAIDQAEAQALVERVTSETKGSIDETRLALNQLAGLGDLDKIEDALKRSQLQAKRLGVNTDLVARATSRLLAKGIAESAEEAELLLERMNDFSRTVLGVDPDEAIDPNDIAEFAAFVNTTNSSVENMLTLLEKTGDGVKDLGQAFEIVEELGLVLNTREGLKELRKQAGLGRDDINQSKGAIENLLVLLEKGGPKSFQALQKALGTDRARAAIEEILGKDLALRIEAGDVSKEEIRLRGQELREELATAADNTATINRIQETNAKLVSTSGANFQDALNKMEKAFSQPKMLEAINTLADKLPALAEQLAGIVEFIAEKPLQAALIALSARIALAAAGGALPGLGKAVAGRVAAASVAGTAAKVGGAGLLAGKAGLGAAATGGAGVLAAGAAGFFGTQAILEATGGDKFFESLGEGLAGFLDTTERAATRGFAARTTGGGFGGRRGGGEGTAVTAAGGGFASRRELTQAEKMAKQTERSAKAMEVFAANAERAARTQEPRGVKKPLPASPGDAAGAGAE